MERLVNYFIGTVIALLPLYLKIGGKDIGRMSKDNLLMVIFGVLIFMLSNKRRELSKSIIVAAIYALVMVVSNHHDPIVTTVMFQMFYIASGIIFFACYFERHSQYKLSAIYNGMTIGCLIQCFFVVTDWVGMSLYKEILEIVHGINIQRTIVIRTETGTLGNPNLLGAYMALTMPAFFRKQWIWFLPLPLFVLIKVDSLMALLTYIAGALYFINLKFKLLHKSILYLGAIVAMVSAFIFGVGGHDSMRFLAWKKILSFVDMEHFLIGKGPGWLASKGILLPDNTIFAQEHNTFLTAFNLFGVIGIALLVPTFIKFLKAKDHEPIMATVVFAAFCNSFGHFNMHQSTTAIIIIVALAICLAGKDNNVVSLEW